MSLIITIAEFSVSNTKIFDQVPLLELQSNFLLSVAATSCCLLFLHIKPLLIGLLTSRGFTGFTTGMVQLSSARALLCASTLKLGIAQLECCYEVEV